MGVQDRTESFQSHSVGVSPTTLPFIENILFVIFSREFVPSVQIDMPLSCHCLLVHLTEVVFLHKAVSTSQRIKEQRLMDLNDRRHGPSNLSS